MQILNSDLRFSLQIAATTISHLNPIVTLSVSFRPKLRSLKLPSLRCFSTSSTDASSAKIADTEDIEKKKIGKPLICTADELHYVSVPNTNWRLAPWRYTPPPQAPPRIHPLLLLFGVGTNTIGYDLDPGSSFARHMACQRFDTWILEVRGAGLSQRGEEADAIEQFVSNGSVSELQKPGNKDDMDVISDVERATIKHNGSAESENFAVKGDTTEMWTIWERSQVTE